MKVCPNCHHEIKEDEFALRCPECGYSFDPIDQNNNGKVTDNVSLFLLILLFIPHLIGLFCEMANSNSKTKRIIFYMVVSTLLIAIIVLLIILFIHYS